MKHIIASEHPNQIFPYAGSITAHDEVEFFSEVKKILSHLQGTAEIRITGISGRGIVTLGVRDLLFCHNLYVTDMFYFTKDTAHRIHRDEEIECTIQRVDDCPIVIYFETRNKPVKD